MRIIIFILIIIISGLIGFEIKRRYVEQKHFLQYLRDFLDYFYLNISIYKNNISEIINNHLIQQKNKSAKYSKIFQKKHNIYSFNTEIMSNYIYDKDLFLTLTLFLSCIGRSSIDEECIKINNINNHIEFQINKTTEDIKSKGDLYFKLWLAIGVIVVLIFW